MEYLDIVQFELDIDFEHVKWDNHEQSFALQCN